MNSLDKMEDYDRLKQERDELAAQVEVMRDALAELKSEAWLVPVQQLMYRGNLVVRRANDALSITPSAALREIQARTLVGLKRDLMAIQEDGSCLCANCAQYVDRIAGREINAAAPKLEVKP